MTIHPTPRRHRIRRHTVLSAVLASLMICGVAVAGDAAAIGQSTVAHGQITGLKQSTGNLYWTSYSPSEFGADTASVWRAAKTNVPGSETLLYQEQRTDNFAFGDLTYANVAGSWYGYFAASYPAIGVYQLKRIPLTGGRAVVVAAVSTPIRDVDSAGGFVYWADAAGVRRVPVTGGAITTLARGNVTHLGLSASSVIYSVGASIHRVALAGGPSSVLRNTASAVTALSVNAPGLIGTYYWGEANGSVTSAHEGIRAATALTPARSGHRITSVSFDGTWTLWTDCLTIGGNHCYVEETAGGWYATFDGTGVGDDFVRADAQAIYWGDVNALHKYTR